MHFRLHATHRLPRLISAPLGPAHLGHALAMHLRLIIANKNYSSWSMRSWVLLRQAGIPFEEVMLPFDSPQWREHMPRLSPTGRVPVLWIDDEAVHDSLAIAETVAELFPDAALWPEQGPAKWHARAVSAEMHASFNALRGAMPMNISANLAGFGDTPASRADIARVVAIWELCRARFGGEGPFLFGRFSIADAMFAPVVTRLRTYGVALSPVAEAYARAVLELPAVAQWCTEARGETAFVAHDEPYRPAPG